MNLNKILLHNIIELLRQIADYLYQENFRPAYMMFVATLPQLEELIKSVDDEQKESIQEKLSVVLDAMEQEDTMLFADTLQYELLDYFVELED